MTARQRTKQHAQLGFSLLELLVVVAIIALLAGAFMLSIGAVGSDRELQQEADRLQTLLTLLSEEAVMESRDYGILFSESGYRFYVFDYATLTWLLPMDDRLLNEHALPEQVQIGLEIEDREVRLIREFADVDGVEQPEPQAVIFASGQTTPVAIDFYRDVTGGRVRLELSFDGSTSVSRDDFSGG